MRRASGCVASSPNHLDWYALAIEGHTIWRTNSGTSLMSALRHGATRAHQRLALLREVETAKRVVDGELQLDRHGRERLFARRAHRRRTARCRHSEVGSAAGLPRAAGWPVPNPVHGDRWGGPSLRRSRHGRAWGRNQGESSRSSARSPFCGEASSKAILFCASTRNRSSRTRRRRCRSVPFGAAGSQVSRGGDPEGDHGDQQR